jgi:DNA-binding MarR family transcriptional regulator
MTTAMDPLRLEQQLCFALYHASRALIRAYAPLLSPLGLTYPQYLVMLVLWEEKVASVKELGARLALDSGTLTPLLKRLEQSGFVSRRRDVADERIVRIELTPEGRKLRSKARDVPAALACRAGFDVSGERERARLDRLRRELMALAERIDGGDAAALSHHLR